MSTPKDELANVVADVSFTTAGGLITSVPMHFQVGPAGAVAGVGGIGIQRVNTGIFDVAIDAGKGVGANTPQASLQCEFSVSFDGDVVTGLAPMLWTVIETPASTATIRIYRFQFFRSTVAVGSVVSARDPVQCTITIRRKKMLLPV